jgi:cytochrome c2
MGCGDAKSIALPCPAVPRRGLVASVLDGEVNRPEMARIKAGHRRTALLVLSATKEGDMRRMAAVVVGLLLAGPVWGIDEQAYYDKKCKVCHTLNGVSGPKAKVGGPLDGVGSKRDEAWIRLYLTDPKAAMPDAKMKRIKMTPEQLDAMVRFMSAQQ